MVGMCTMKTAGVLMVWSRRIKGPHHHLFPCLAVLQTLVCDRSQESAGQETKPVELTKPADMRQVWHKGRSPPKASLFKKEYQPILHIQEHVSAQRGTTKAALPPRRTFAAALFSTQDEGDVRSSTQKKSFLHKFNNCDSLSFLLRSDTKTESFTITIQELHCTVLVPVNNNVKRQTNSKHLCFSSSLPS